MFTESNTVESMLIDLLSGPIEPAVNAPLILRQPRAPYATAGRSKRGVGWQATWNRSNCLAPQIAIS